MATLVDPQGVHHLLASTTIIGRSQGLPIVIDKPYVSGVHAQVRWSPAGWEVLHTSRSNPTYRNDAPLPRDEWVALAEDDRLSFGVKDEPWVLTDTAPTAYAACGERIVVEIDGVLAFPDDADPEFVICASVGSYTLQESSDPEVPAGGVLPDKQTFTSRTGDRWVVHFPSSSPTQVLHVARAADARVKIISDGIEEAVAIELMNNGHFFAPRVHFSLLLQLARARRRDEVAGDKDPSEHGWCSMEVLSEEIGIPLKQLNVYIHRARRAFEGVIGDYFSVIDRSGAVGFLRIGFTHVQIIKAGVEELPEGPRPAQPSAR